MLHDGANPAHHRGRIPGQIPPKRQGKSDPGPPLRRHFVTPKVAQVPMTLGGAAAARVRFIVWCKGYRYQVEPDPAEIARRYGPETPVPEWRSRLVCSRCGSRETDIMVTGERR
jgi:hypothetical protein